MYLLLTSILPLSSTSVRVENTNVGRGSFRDHLLGKRAVHLVNHIFLLLVFPFVNLVISYFVFKGRIVVLIAPDSGHCFLLTFYFLVMTKSIVFVDDLGLRLPTCQGHLSQNILVCTRFGDHFHMYIPTVLREEKLVDKKLFNLVKYLRVMIIIIIKLHWSERL